MACYSQKLAANIVRNCSRPLVGGYTGRALLIPADEWERAKLVTDAANPQKVRNIILPASASVQVFVVENYGATPFTGSTTAGNNDSGVQKFSKTLTLRVPQRGADAARKIVQPLARGVCGYVAIIEKRDRVGDGSFEIVGMQQPLYGDAATITRDELSGGAWSISLTTTEMWAEATLVGSDDTYESARAEFRELLNDDEPSVRVVFGADDDGELDPESDWVQARVSCVGDLYCEYVPASGAAQWLYLGANLQEDSVDIDENNVHANCSFTLYGTITALAVDSDTISPNSSFGNITELILTNQPQLNELYCYSNQLTTLDVSRNVELTNLNCGSNQLTTLDVSRNVALTYLDCYANQLTTLDVSGCVALTFLDCNSNQLTTLDVSGCVALTYLYCYSNQLTTLDVSGCVALTNLYCYSNQLTTLDVSGCTRVTNFNFIPTSPTTLTSIRAVKVSAKIYSTLNSSFSKLASSGTLTTDGTTASATLRSTATAKGWTVNIVS